VLAAGRTGALTCSDGTVDWWCPDAVDGAPLLWRLVDRRGAAIRIGPTGRSSSEQAYLDRTLVARTVFTSAGGEVEVVDVLPSVVGRSITPTLLRIVTGRRGEVEVEVDVAAGRSWRPSTRVDVFNGGMAFDGWMLRAPGVEMTRTEAGGRGTTILGQGERLVVSMRRGDELALSERESLDLLELTSERWRRLAGSTLYGGLHADAVARSVLLLHGLDARSLTTSVPAPSREDMAHDSRHRWISDACSAVHLLSELGHQEGSENATDWLERVVERTPPLAAAATVDGEAPEVEAVHERLDGFKGGPVRTGLTTHTTPDHDPLGGLATVVEDLAPARWSRLRTHADWAADHVRDDGSLAGRIRVWAFLDAMTTAAVARNPLDLDAAGWRTTAREVARAAERALATTDANDPRLLRLPWQGPLPAHHPLVAATVDRVLERRGEGPFVHGAELGSPAASWWAVRALALLGRWEEAHDRAERLVTWAGDNAILPRSVEPATGRFAGDVPDASGHLALLSAALTLSTGPR